MYKLGRKRKNKHTMLDEFSIKKVSHYRTDEELIISVGSGDKKSFDLLVDRYKNQLVNFIFHLIGDKEVAEDLAQETFIRVYKHSNRYDPKYKFSTWIYTIASNLAKNEIRNREKHSFFFISKNDDSNAKSKLKSSKNIVSSVQDDSNRPDLVMEKNEISNIIMKAIKSLPESFRMAIVMRDIQGLSYEEIAQVMNCSEGTIKSRINRARLKVKDELVKLGLFEN